MIGGYFNYSSHLGTGWWDRRGFLRRWWAIYSDDRRWTPPHYPTLRRLLSPGESEHLDRQNPLFLHMEALPGRRGEGGRNYQYGDHGDSGECCCLVDGFAPAAIGQRTWACCIVSTMRKAWSDYVGAVMEQLWPMGYQRLIGPTGLSPHLQSGVLMDHYHVIPPMHTPYNPPYIPEIIGSVMAPLAHSRLYHISVDCTMAKPRSAGINVMPAEPRRLSQDLLPLVAETYAADNLFPPPDELEARFLVRWLANWPLYLWVAEVEGIPVGFVLLQPDLSADLAARPWRTQSHLAVVAGLAQPTSGSRGRIVFGGVLPEWRRRGIGRHLW